MKYFVRAILATIIAALLSSCSYNSMVEADENINAQWAKVENQYQRRADLVPNLVNTVKGYAAHESETLEAVIAARSKATQITVDPANLTEENLQKYQEAQGELSSALGKLLAITENQNFLELQAQLEGTENRIATERSRYTDAVNAYNKKIRKFPALITAKIFGFDAKPQFKAEASAAQAPTVEF